MSKYVRYSDIKQELDDLLEKIELVSGGKCREIHFTPNEHVSMSFDDRCINAWPDK